MVVQAVLERFALSRRHTVERLPLLLNRKQKPKGMSVQSARGPTRAAAQNRHQSHVGYARPEEVGCTGAPCGHSQRGLPVQCLLGSHLSYTGEHLAEVIYQV